MVERDSSKTGIGRLIGWLVAWTIFLGLAGIGINIAITATKVLLSWQHVQQWQPVTARLEKLELHKVPKEPYGTYAYEITARYHYTLDGKSYTSERVGSYEGSREIDGWHDDTYERLQRSSRQSRQHELAAWIDPAHPENAVLDRSLRWVVPLVLFPVAALFLGGAGLMGYGMRMDARHRTERPASAIERCAGDPDIREVPEWRTGAVKSDALGTVVIAWLLPFMAGLVGWGAAISGYHHGRLALSGAAALLGCGLLGIWLTRSALKKTLRFFKQGWLYLRLTPFPARLGREVRGSINLNGITGAEDVRVTVTCLREHHEDSDSSMHEVLWEKLLRVRTQAGPRGSMLDFALDLPEQLPASVWRGRPAKEDISWFVALESANAGINYSFKIPVLADPDAKPQAPLVSAASEDEAEQSGKSPQMIAMLRTMRAMRARKMGPAPETPATDPATQAKPDISLADTYIERRGSEWRLDTRRQPNMKNMRWSGLLFLLIAPFCGIFPALWYSMARWHGNFLEITLTAIGGIVILLPALLVPLLAFAGIERMSKRIRVDTLGGHIEVRKTSWLWSKTTRFNTTDVAIVNAISSGREMVGHRSYSYYNILATLVNGKIIELVWAVRDTDIAAALAVVLNHACGSPRSTTGAGVRIAQWRRPAVPLLAMLLLAAALPSAVEMSLQTPMWDGYDNDTDRLEHLAAQAADPGYFQQWLRTDDTLHLPPLWLLTRWITETRNRLAAQRKAQPDVSVISLPSNPQPVVIDGRIDEREWQGSVLLALQPETAGSVLRLRSDGQRLIVAADVPADTTAEGFDQLRVSLHMGLVPALVSERIHVDRSGGISVLRFLRAEVVGEQASSKTRTYSKTHTQRLRYEKTLAATRVDGHRRYELSIDMQEAGLAADVPFTLWAEIEGDPQHHADGKFKARTNLGLIGEHGQPLWLKIAP